MNYQANIIEIGKIEERTDLKTINKAIVLMDVELVVSKSIKKGDVVVYFEPETAVCHELLSFLNMYSDKTLNSDTSVRGYVDKNRRVRSIELQKIRSSGLIIPIEEFKRFCKEYKLQADFEVGSSFDHVGEFKICERYVSQKLLNIRQQEERRLANLAKSGGKISKKDLPKSSSVTEYIGFEKHITTAHWRHARSYLKEGDKISITPKIHGTSQRLGLVEQKTATTYRRNWLEKLLNKINSKWFPLTEAESKWDFVTGTRNVIVGDKNKLGFHGSEAWRISITEQCKEVLEQLSENNTKSVVIYGEVFGYVNGKPIMSNHSTSGLPKEYIDKYGDTIVYHYGQNEASCGFKIYRVVIDGIDLSQKMITHLFSDEVTFKVLYEEIFDGDFERLGKLVKELTERPDCLTEDYCQPDQVSEGVIVRAEREGLNTPILLKSKSWVFCNLEGFESNNEVEIEDIS